MELQDTVAELRRELAQLKEQAEAREQEQVVSYSKTILTRNVGSSSYSVAFSLYSLDKIVGRLADKGLRCESYLCQ